jgi:hypothetical protein
MNYENSQRIEGGPLDGMVRRLVAEGVNTGKMTRDERHDYVVRTFPGGLNGLQFAALTLLSADDYEVVDPPSVSEWFQKQSQIMRLWLDGLIERRCRRDEAGPYYLAAKGRALLKTPNV